MERQQQSESIEDIQEKFNLPKGTSSLVTIQRKKFLPIKGSVNMACVNERKHWPWHFLMPKKFKIVPIRK